MTYLRLIVGAVLVVVVLVLLATTSLHITLPLAVMLLGLFVTTGPKSPERNLRPANPSHPLFNVTARIGIVLALAGLVFVILAARSPHEQARTALFVVGLLCVVAGFLVRVLPKVLRGHVHH
jgi:hypothetical protein